MAVLYNIHKQTEKFKSGIMLPIYLMLPDSNSLHLISHRYPNPTMKYNWNGQTPWRRMFP